MPPPHIPLLPSSMLATICGMVWLASCSPEKPEPPAPVPEPTSESEPAHVAPLVHAAELALAHQHLSHRPDLALATLASLPAAEESLNLLAAHTWHLPVTRFDHADFIIHHIEIRDTSLWVGLSSPTFHTVVRWNLDTLEIEAVLFPTRENLRAVVLSPTGSHAVITRGHVTLLVDAITLKPIADLGELPAEITPQSAIAFSPDSIFLAHPDSDGWVIRDSASGEILRSIPSEEIDFMPILAAHIDHHRLRLLAANGTRIDAPISPIEPIEIIPFEEDSLALTNAHFIQKGENAIIIRDMGPHESPAPLILDLTDSPTPDFEIDAWATQQSHSPLPGLSSGLLRQIHPPPLALADSFLRFHGIPYAPLATPSRPIAFAADPERHTLATAEANGHLTLHFPIALPHELPPPEVIAAIAGHHYHREAATCTAIPAEIRHTLLASLETPPPAFRATTATQLLPLMLRLADTESATPTARNLADALAQDDPAIVAAALEAAENLPPTLRTLAASHIHHRNGNTAAAFHPYLDGFPDLAAIRHRADWHGWEQPDFQPALTALVTAYQAIIETLAIPPEADETELREVIARLTDPATLTTLGSTRFATACLDAATALSTIPGENEATLRLAGLARQYGALPAPCLRAEAVALTALGQYQSAHTRWIELITEHPVPTHLPGDYAEAAYTAFENADARQALEILITGMHRFDGDAAFALRAGWVALLTGHPDHARAFLLKGDAIGFPQDSLENATALLAASAALTQDTAAATAHFQDLITLDPAWTDPATIESLPWPEHLKSPLRQLIW